MRLIKNLQLFLRPAKIETEVRAEMDEILKILSNAQGIRKVYDRVLLDVNGGRSVRTGAEGLTAEQIVLLGIIKIRMNATYRELSELTGDSLSVRALLNLCEGTKISKSTIHSNLKPIQESTWKMLNDCILEFAKQENIEDGTSLRADTTTTENNIHYPTDASLLFDSVKVLTRAMNRLKAWVGAPIKSCDHYRRAKKRLFKINNSRVEKVRHKNYLDMIRVAKLTLEYAEQALIDLESFFPTDHEILLTLTGLEAQLYVYIPRVKLVINQAHRRIVKKEKVPATEKIFSIFEPDTDIIVKGQRDIVFGHKILIATGKSSMITQLSTLDGNPADSTLVEQVLDEHKRVYKNAPSNLAFDGGFASIENRDKAKLQGVENITFSKNGSMELKTLVQSEKQHKSLMRFRAGVEGCISFLKRSFNATKILDRTRRTFAAVLQCATATYNLTIVARFRLIAAQT